MYAHPQQSAGHDVQKLRKDAGKWLKELRESAGLTQRQLAERVGVEYYTFISQLEVGRGRIPPDRYERWAAALHMRPADFVKQLMRFYDPETYRLLFGEAVPEETSCASPEKDVH
ncbi:MAG: helix-turn-helix transcriptional regulator [Methanobacterium sp.]|nr:helix-turn-helix transcriptional regulator [Methanobacterium sp.]